MRDENDYEKPVALVTGSATGIGRSAAIALAKNGYDVVINYSRSEDAAKVTAGDSQAAGARTLLFRCDVSDDACVRAMLAATEKEFGRLDVLINNAGTTVDVEPKNFEAMQVGMANDDLLGFEKAQNSRNGFCRQTEIVGDVMAAHGQVDKAGT